jgi:hypothetical protein
MLNQRQIMDRWLERKFTGTNFYRLQEPFALEFEFQGKQWGHPSNYASVYFTCEPSCELLFQPVLKWPEALDPKYCASLERAILMGVVDGLIGDSFYPYSGCSLALSGIRWDDVMSSEVAFYKAARGGMKELISGGMWRIEPTT